MKKYYKRIFNRNDNKNLLIFSSKEHTEKNTQELDPIKSPDPHIRWHPFQQEWVAYSAGR